ncbi:MAG: DUF255 domain-containing protein [Gammaproteobacteria bacterium]|nr:DUF255 domain-containing protein [Gammaproteobacteria bacterium]
MSVGGALAEQNEVEWREWQPAAFVEAKRSGKLIFVDVGMEGCTACRRMDEITLTHPEVIELLNANFIPMQVDSEARPDIGDRYSDWAWPALIFMTPDATQVLALRGNRLPGNFVPILEGLIKALADGTLSADSSAPLAAPVAPITTQLTLLRKQVRSQMDRRLNETLGSWRANGMGSTAGARGLHLMYRAHMYDNGELRRIGLQTANGYLKLLDPVWGGVFQAYFVGSGRPLTVIPEKRISGQAHGMMVFAEAYQLTGDVRYLNGIKKVDAYLQDWMAAPDGSYFTSQEDAAPNLTGRIGTKEYWAFRTDHERRQFGIPPIDHAVYTDKNAEVIRAYVRAFEATGDMNYLGVARKAATTLLTERMTGDGWMLQALESNRVAADRRMRKHLVQPRPYLSAQVWFGSALLALYGATGDDHWLDDAERIARAMGTELEDQRLGGFYASKPDALDSVVVPRKPVELNARAAHFLYDLGVYTKNARYSSLPERTIRAIAIPEAVRREGKIIAELGLVLEKMHGGYVEFSIVGEPRDERARRLFARSRASYHPRKLVHYEKPGRYPEREQPALYICNVNFCTVPIYDPHEITEHLEGFRAPAYSS